MNPMLKAQMLATALDVYFSDPTLGGNLINAPTPVGARNIDLLNVCADAVSCSSYENASSAFNGASALTVGQMLTYAASQSIVGGSMWYGNVKPTQELAKDARDFPAQDAAELPERVAVGADPHPEHGALVAPLGGPKRRQLAEPEVELAPLRAGADGSQPVARPRP